MMHVILASLSNVVTPMTQTVDRLGYVDGRHHIDLRKDIQNLDHPILFLAGSEA